MREPGIALMNLSEVMKIEQYVAGCHTWLESWQRVVRPGTPLNGEHLALAAAFVCRGGIRREASDG